MVLTNTTDVSSQYNVNWSADGRSFSINFGNLSENDHFQIRYKANSSYGFVDGEVLKNTATLTGDNLDKVSRDNTIKYFAAGGSGEGYIYSIKINKKSKDGTPLANAKFDIIRVATGIKVGTITINASGQGEFTGLLKDKYKLQETVAPDGFKLLDNPVIVNISDFGTNKVAQKTIVNEPAISTEKIHIPVKKQWVGKATDSVTVKLFADTHDTGKTIILNEIGQWKGSFNNLLKYDGVDDHKINYTIKEEKVSGYSTTITGNSKAGYIITNTKNSPPKKPNLPKKPSLPETGDSSNIGLFTALLSLSGALLVIFGLKHRKQRKRS